VIEREGFVPVESYRLYYRTFGGARAKPFILALHGGPGGSHDYLTPLVDLTNSGFRVALFDQLGCGRSDVPNDSTLFSVEHHIEEVERVRKHLRLGRVHLIGSSYGGLLALAYALRHPEALRSLVTVGGLASVPLAQEEMNRLREELPAETLEMMRRHERAGEFENPEYLAAVDAFYHRHVCRLSPWPPELLRTFQLIAARPVYRVMNGPNEFTITGTIRDYDLSGELPKIRVPTLVLGGRFDEVTPTVAEQIHRGIPGSRRMIFENSSHLPFWEERGRFMEVVSDFLRSVDRENGPRSPPSIT
jgi:proline iminopeptidase